MKDFSFLTKHTLLSFVFLFSTYQAFLQTDTSNEVIRFKIADKGPEALEPYIFKVVDGNTGEPIQRLAFSVIYQNEDRLIRYSDQLGELVIGGDAVSIRSMSRLYEPITTNVSDLPATIILQPISYSIDPVFVEGYFQELPQNQPASISTLRSSDFDRDAQHSLKNQLNTLPGVQMESRGMGGSRRLSIRGSFIRSPFAVRNI
ncbi:MAG: TonB-dependent receptor plug domain-containing protein, partial [Flavobacteriales bacterium]|nr:TonB-dependent receptor plug domain-containing protein [Flavobacteriales bacterium]